MTPLEKLLSGWDKGHYGNLEFVTWLIPELTENNIEEVLDRLSDSLEGLLSCCEGLTRSCKLDRRHPNCELDKWDLFLSKAKEKLECN